MDSLVKDLEEGGLQKGLAGGNVLVGGDVRYKMRRLDVAAVKEEGVGDGDEEDGRDKVAELAAALVGYGGGEAALAAYFFRLDVGEARAFHCREMEFDVGLGRGSVRCEVFRELEGGEGEA